MQPAGWEQPSGAATPRAGESAPQPGWGDQAPGFANPAPTWGPPGGGPWTGSALDEADEPRKVGGTIAAHVVLWLGLVLVAAVGYRVVRPLAEAGVPYTVYFAVTAVLQLLPVVVALVLAGRSAVLRVTGAVAGLVLIGVAVLFVLRQGDYATGWIPRIAVYVFGLGSWMVVRRHARSGYLLLVPLALLLLLWFPSWGPAPQIVGFLSDQGVRSPFLLSLWSYVPVLVTALVGLLSSVLRPRPTRSGDALGWAVTGGLAAVLAVTVVANHAVDALR